MRPSSPNLEGRTSAKEEIYEEIDDLNDVLQHDFREFVKSTIDPILMLRDDLLMWLKENRHKLAVGHRDEEREIEIAETVKSVKQQQTSIMQSLDSDRCSLEQELATELGDLQSKYIKVQPDSRLNSARSDMTSASSSFGGLQITTGVPRHLYSLHCPDQDLADACFDEFDVLDERYVMELEALEEKYEDVITRLVYSNLGFNEFLVNSTNVCNFHDCKYSNTFFIHIYCVWKSCKNSNYFDINYKSPKAFYEKHKTDKVKKRTHCNFWTHCRIPY